MGGQTTRRDRLIFKGSVSVLLVDAFKDIVFSSPMPLDAQGNPAYDIYMKVPQSGTLVNTIGNKTVNGFRINLTVSIAGTVDWAAVEIIS